MTFCDQLSQSVQWERDVQVAFDVARIDMQMVGFDLIGGRVRSQTSEARVAPSWVLTFEIHADKVTTLEVYPVVKKQTHSSFLVKVKMFMPDLTVKVIDQILVTSVT